VTREESASAMSWLSAIAVVEGDGERARGELAASEGWTASSRGITLNQLSTNRRSRRNGMRSTRAETAGRPRAAPDGR
jgi:hypothetical protein